MRWDCKPLPTEGDIKIKKKFLLFPKNIDCETRWLEFVEYEQKYERCYYYYQGNRYYNLQWVNKRWLN
jgi:hypothetical protein